jgi:hypothetical protein
MTPRWKQLVKKNVTQNQKCAQEAPLTRELEILGDYACK